MGGLHEVALSGWPTSGPVGWFPQLTNVVRCRNRGTSTPCFSALDHVEVADLPFGGDAVDLIGGHRRPVVTAGMPTRSMTGP